MKTDWNALALIGLLGVSAFVPAASLGDTTGRTRTYYIAADEVT